MYISEMHNCSSSLWIVDLSGCNTCILGKAALKQAHRKKCVPLTLETAIIHKLSYMWACDADVVQCLSCAARVHFDQHEISIGMSDDYMKICQFWSPADQLVHL